MLCLLLGGAAATARAADVTVTWETPGGRTVPQGLPLRFEAVIENPSDGALTLSLSFELHPKGAPERAVAFERWTGSVAGGSKVRVRGSVTPAQWFPERGPFRVAVRSSAVDVPGLAFRVTEPPVVVPKFDDVTLEAGMGTDHLASIECDGYSAGAAWGDVDGDDDLDLYLPHQDGPSQLWLNEGESFTEVADERGVADAGESAIAAVFADYDNDSDQDLYVVDDGANRLYSNDGSGHFVDVAPAAGVDEAGPGSSATWGDYDSDGHLDLFVVNWARCGSSSDYTYFDDALFHNEGDGTFTDQTELLESTGSTTGAGFQAAWFDYDRDGDVDLYLANDYGGPRPEGNYLWRNDGRKRGGGWRFTNVSIASGTALHMNTMGIGLGDYDRDLDLDMALSNIEATALLRNSGEGTFRDVAGPAGVGRPNQRVREKAITWGLAFADLNLDGWEDLYVVGGSLAQENRPEPQPNATFANVGSPPAPVRFADLSAPSGAADEGVGRGLSLADYDRDGRVDLYVVNQGGRPILYRNVTPTGRRHWLEVRLAGRARGLGETPDGEVSNRDGCGATLVATLGRTKLLRQVFCGSVGLGGGSDRVVHFGLGRAARVDSLRIVWPSGRVQTLEDIPADRLVDVKEPARR
ncbi:MAG TPA: CRTAC1 family protein [Actinomycetota bacterium]|nr:CRTAC1 family protein [Actinomycetota bacterium]